MNWRSCRRFRSFIISAITSAAFAFCIALFRGDADAPAPTSTDLAEQRINRALAELSALNAQDIPLRDVVGQLSRRHQIPFALDYDALRDVGLTGNEPVNLNVSGVALRDLLHLALRQLNLCHTVYDGALVITAPEARKERMPELVGKVYLLPPPTRGSRSLGEEAMADFIMSTVACVSWADVGGVAEIHVLPGALVVIHAPEIHDQVASLLSQVERWPELPDTASPVFLSAADRNHWRLVQRLKQTVDVEFPKASLEDVCRRLSKEYDVPIVIDRESLTDAGIAVDVPITMDLRGVPLAIALREMLRDVELGYSVLDVAIEITADGGHGHMLLARAYPVGDLVGPRGRGEGCRFLKSVTSLVHPQSWGFVGGPHTAELLDNRLLLVCAERETHEEVELFLGELRHALDSEAPLADGLGISPAIRKIELALRQMTSLQFEEVRVADVAEWVRARYGINTEIAGYTFNDAAVNLDKPITCDIRDASLEDALREVLRPLGLYILVCDDVLWFVPSEDRDHEQMRRYYDVRQLVDPDYGLVDRPTLVELVQQVIGRNIYYAIIYRGVLIVLETPDNQRAVGRSIGHLADNAARLRQEMLSADASTEAIFQHLLEEMHAHVVPRADVGADAEEDNEAGTVQ